MTEAARPTLDWLLDDRLDLEVRQVTLRGSSRCGGCDEPLEEGAKVVVVGRLVVDPGADPLDRTVMRRRFQRHGKFCADCGSWLERRLAEAREEAP